MTAKYRAQYRKQQRVDQAARISAVDEAALELMRKLRTHTYGRALLDDPRSLATAALQKAIDDMAEVITGDPEYFYAKLHSIGPETPKGV